MPQRLTVLIVEDNPADRMLLSTIVSRQGHRVLTANNGLEAVAIFEQERPKLVLLDALMPVMDGFEAARRIKALTGDELVPIIFLTSLSEGQALAQCLEAGGDDFLAKPYNRVLLEAKISAMDRLRQLHATVVAQRDLLARHREQLLLEQRRAKEIFDKVAHLGSLQSPGIRYLQSPYALFNGDLMLAAHDPSGNLQVMLGDFTGHGLPAAIGIMPVAELFYSMTSKGHGLSEILRAINSKLKQVLPVGVFCCAFAARINAQRGVLEVWNGGLPDGYLLRGNCAERVPLVSRNLPLGIVESEAFDARTELHGIGPGDQLLLLSDGVLECSNARGERFGEQRLLQVLNNCTDNATLFDRLQSTLWQFSGQPSDDVSLLMVALEQATRSDTVIWSDGGLAQRMDWSAQFVFRADSLRHFNPMPHLLGVLLEQAGLRTRAGALFTVLSELYSNALEHGVLGLDSTLKCDAQGFADYYRLRRQRLADLKEGFVCFDLQVRPQGEGGCLQIAVHDSGGYCGDEQSDSEVRRYHGRGLQLVRELSDACYWAQTPQRLCVEFHWGAQA